MLEPPLHALVADARASRLNSEAHIHKTAKIALRICLLACMRLPLLPVGLVPRLLSSHCTRIKRHSVCYIELLHKPPPPSPSSVGPNFSHHKARVQAVGWFPLGTRKQGSRPFAAPTPPQQKGGGLNAGPAPPPPPACPRTLTAGRHMVIEVPQGADAERRVCWDLGPAW